MPVSRKRGWMLLMVVALGGLAGCSTTPPSNTDDACVIFKEKRGWYKSSYRAFKEYGVPVHVQLAIIHQESHFKADAKPERTKLLWVIPWTRKSSAYGYAQVKDDTWDWYRSKTQRFGADRDEFEDATEFVAWYANLSHRKLGLSKWDAYRQYLAYHEGMGGYQRKTYSRKPWLVKVARKVKARAGRYGAQLKRCEDELDKGWWFWPF